MKRVLCAAIFLIGACGGGGGGGTPDGGSGGSGGSSAAVVYYRDVQPIVQKHCESCHMEGGVAPFALDGYQAASDYAAEMVRETAAKRMPPWLPAPGCGEFQHARGLTDAEIATIKTWNDLGKVAGNPADAPPRPMTSAAPDLGTPDAILDIGTDYRPVTAVPDDYHCFITDPQTTTDRDLVGFDVVPGDRRVVHHVLLYAVATPDVAAVRAKDAASPETGYTCYGGPGVTTALIGGWVPGGGLTAFPASTGLRVAKGSLVIVQIHYNTLMVKDAVDRTTTRLFFADAPVARPARVSPVANTRFLVPAGTKEQTVTAELTVPAPATLWGVVPHMHVLGTKIKVEVLRRDGTHACAVDIPRWDFNWQQFYFYRTPIAVGAGDKVKLSCTFDNSPGNQPYVNGVQGPPKDLRWGEGTLDEMCLNYLYSTSP